jgi:trehalose-phosphatase
MAGGESWPGLPEGFWERVAHSRERLVVLDYDGTLSRFQVRRALAQPLPGALEALRDLAASPGTEVAVLSGRPVADLRRFFAAEPGLQRVQLLGEHGWERLAGGRLERAPMPIGAAEALKRGAEAARGAGLADLIEEKRTALALHTRGLPRERAAEREALGRELWTPLARPGELRLDRFDGGLELRASSRDKGTAMRELSAAAPPGALLLYVGDDETDEAAFREVGPRGFGLRVTRRARPTAAHGTLASCADVVRWLEHLSHSLAEAS